MNSSKSDEQEIASPNSLALSNMWTTTRAAPSGSVRLVMIPLFDAAISGRLNKLCNISRRLCSNWNFVVELGQTFAADRHGVPKRFRRAEVVTFFCLGRSGLGATHCAPTALRG